MIAQFKKTVKQSEATRLFSNDETHCMAFGGSRSGKTFDHVRRIVIRACKVKSRHVILRQRFNHAKTSIWLDTLPKVMNICFPELDYQENKTDYFISLPNGSEIWIGGLDDKERTEKILGKEYSTIYFNEITQIHYSSVQIALTRLAEKNELRKKAYYDMNPPSKKHWSYWLFIKGIDPQDNVPVDQSDYCYILMNPQDNLENIDENYLKLLEKMPEREKNRFLYGVFADDSDGQAYYSFSRENHVQDTSGFKIGSTHCGLDFNVQPMTAVIASYVNNCFYIHDERFLENSDTFKMSKELISGGYKGAVLYPDSTGRNRKTSGASDFEILKSNGFTIHHTRNPLVVDRINNINRLFQENRIIINPKCRKLITDLEKVSWKNSELDKKTDPMLTHISDALGYLCWAIDPLREKEAEAKTIQL